MNSNFKTRAIHLTPILTSLAFGVLCAHLLSTTQTEYYKITPFQEGAGSFGNALYFVVLVSIGATVLYLLLKRKSIRLVVLITGFALTTAVFMLSVIYLNAILLVFNVSSADNAASILIPSFAITILVDFAVFRTRNKICDFAVLLLGGALGAFLGNSIPTLSATLILGFLAVYDVFAVCHGPVGKIAHSGLEHLRGLSFSFKDLQMGLGDITFYSMLIGKVLIDAGPIFCVASTAGVLVGVFLAFKMLEKKGMFPGLPFPIAFGLIPLIISSFL